MAVLTLWEENNPCVGIEQIGFVASLWFTNIELRYRFLN
jgi:hypothetical protein